MSGAIRAPRDSNPHGVMARVQISRHYVAGRRTVNRPAKRISAGTVGAKYFIACGRPYDMVSLSALVRLDLVRVAVGVNSPNRPPTVTVIGRSTYGGPWAGSADRGVRKHHSIGFFGRWLVNTLFTTRYLRRAD